MVGYPTAPVYYLFIFPVLLLLQNFLPAFSVNIKAVKGHEVLLIHNPASSLSSRQKGSFELTCVFKA